MLRKSMVTLVRVLALALACGLIFPLVASAGPISVSVQGDIDHYLYYQRDYTTGEINFVYEGVSGGTLSGTFAWDPALMDADSSVPPLYSYREDLGSTVWLTSILTAVTPDFVYTFDPSTLPRPLYSQALYGTAGQMMVNLDHREYVNGGVSVEAAHNSFLLNDYGQLTPTLGYQDGQFVPLSVNFDVLNGSGTIEAMETRLGHLENGDLVATTRLAHATLTGATSIATPEPSSSALLAIGLITLGVGARRRKQNHYRT